MDGARGYNAKRNKSQKDKYHEISLMWNLRNNTSKGKKNRQSKKQTLNYRELMVTRGEGVGDGLNR